MPVPESWLECGPYVIGATGGSGTRVLARVTRDAGMFIGTFLGNAEDAKAFGMFGRTWINAYAKADDLPAAERADLRARMVREFDEAVDLHCLTLRDGPRPWGWKSPPSIFLLPFIHEQFPRMKFVHIVRDGRDMAFSDNQRQLAKHGDTVLGDEAGDDAQPVRSVALWSDSNVRCADYGEAAMGDRYLRIRLEDLCAEPARWVGRLFAFLGLDGDAAAIAAAEIQTPSSLGRWQQQDPALVAEVTAAGLPGLVKFGYVAGDGRS